MRAVATAQTVRTNAPPASPRSSRFDVDRSLGAGGFGEVYLARMTATRVPWRIAGALFVVLVRTGVAVGAFVWMRG